MARKKTEVRVKRTEAWAAIRFHSGTIDAESNGRFFVWRKPKEPTWLKPVTIIDRAELEQIEYRNRELAAEVKRLNKQLKAAGVIIRTLRENHP